MSVIATPPRDLFRAPQGPTEGRYFGPMPEVDLSSVVRRRGRAFAIAKQKRWLYAIVTNGKQTVICAVTQLGYAANAFYAVASEEDGMMRSGSFLGIPKATTEVGLSPEAGCFASHKGNGGRIRIERAGENDAYKLNIVADGLEVEAQLAVAGAPPPMGAVAKLPGGDLNVTAKRWLMPAQCEVALNGGRFEIKDGLGGLDFTHGFLPYDTAWHWLFFMGVSKEGAQVACNLVEGFNGAVECALVVDGEYIPLEEGAFSFDASDWRKPWHIRTHCGVLDVNFEGYAAHAEKRNLGLVKADFLQPMGTFSGKLNLPDGRELTLERVAGVVENQAVRW